MFGILSAMIFGKNKGFYGYEDELSYMQDMARMEDEQRELDLMAEERYCRNDYADDGLFNNSCDSYDDSIW